MKAPGTEHTGSGPFVAVEGAIIIINKNGTFIKALVLTRGGFVFGCDWLSSAEKSKGIFALKSDGKTTIDNLKWDEIIGVEVEFSTLGRMVVKS